MRIEDLDSHFAALAPLDGNHPADCMIGCSRSACAETDVIRNSRAAHTAFAARSTRSSLLPSLPLETVPIRVLAAQAAPPHLEAGNVDSDQKQPAQLARRAAQRAHAVPGVLGPFKEQAAVSPRLDRRGHLELVKAGAGVSGKAALAVEDEDFAAPG